VLVSNVGKSGYEALKVVALQRSKRASAVDTLKTGPRTPGAKVNEHSLKNYVEHYCRLYKDITSEGDGGGRASTNSLLLSWRDSADISLGIGLLLHDRTAPAVSRHT
jgi:hypothetical protein